MSRKQTKNIPDNQEDIEEVSSDEDSVEMAEDDVRQRIGMPLEEFNALFKKNYMAPDFFKWLRGNRAYVDFIREIVISSLEGLGYPSKKTIPAGQHPIWVTTDQCLKGFRDDPNLKGAEAQKLWLKQLVIKGAPENGFKESDYDTAAHFVSLTWRRYRNGLKKKVMAVVFSDTWGTEDFPVTSGPDMAEFFETEAGTAQLRHWVLKSLMNIDDSMIDYVTPPPNYVAFIKGLLVTLRTTYKSHEEMKRKEACKSKEKSAEKLDQRMRKKYNETLVDESEESDLEDSPTPSELQEEEPKKKKTLQSTMPVKKRQFVNKKAEEEQDFVEEQQPPCVSKPATKRTEKESERSEESETSLGSKKIRAKPAPKPVEQPSGAKKVPDAAKLTATLVQKLQNACPANSDVALTKKKGEKEEKEKSNKKKTPSSDLAPTRLSQRTKERESTSNNNNTNVVKKSTKRTAEEAELTTSGSPNKKQRKGKNT